MGLDMAINMDPEHRHRHRHGHGDRHPMDMDKDIDIDIPFYNFCTTLRYYLAASYDFLQPLVISFRCIIQKHVKMTEVSEVTYIPVHFIIQKYCSGQRGWMTASLPRKMVEV